MHVAAFEPSQLLVLAAPAEPLQLRQGGNTCEYTTRGKRILTKYSSRYRIARILIGYSRIHAQYITKILLGYRIVNWLGYVLVMLGIRTRNTHRIPYCDRRLGYVRNTLQILTCNTTRIPYCDRRLGYVLNTLQIRTSIPWEYRIATTGWDTYWIRYKY